MKKQPKPSSQLCPCHSGKLYESCCEPYHKAISLPKTAVELMRSRYSAYALKNADYIIETTHPKNPAQSNKEQILHFCNTTQFDDLEILDSTATTVTFHASLRQAGEDVSFTEKSLFESVKGKWLYLSVLERHVTEHP